MNAQNIWAGHHYAHIAYRNRGQDYAENAERIRVIRVIKRPARYGAERDSTFVLCTMMDDEGNRLKEWSGTEREPVEVRARDIVSLWQDYAQERMHRRQLAAQRAAEETARREATANANQAFRKRFVEVTGIPENIVSFSSGYIMLHENKVRQWLDEYTPLGEQPVSLISNSAEQAERTVPVPTSPDTRPVVTDHVDAKPVVHVEAQPTSEDPDRVSDVWDYGQGGE